MIEAVTFDFWNTLAYEERDHLRGQRLAAWAGVLEDAGFAVERAALDGVLEAAWRRYVERWSAGEVRTHVEVAEEIVESLGFDVPPAVRRELVGCYGRAGESATLRLAPGAAETLRVLKAAGVRLGIVCDVGLTPSSVLRTHLDRHGVLDLFDPDGTAFSDEVGCYKPAPAIFEHALRGLGVPARDAAHVGDLRRTDVAGSLAVGMTAVRYTGIHDDTSQEQPEGHHVLDDHRKLPAALGLT